MKRTRLYGCKALLIVAFWIGGSENLVARSEPQQESSSQSLFIQVEPGRIRFTVKRDIESLRIQVFDRMGTLVFESDTVSGDHLLWAIKDLNGDPLRSGLYSFTLTIREHNTPAAERRGHFIVERADERQGDRLWVTTGGADEIDTSVSGGEITVSNEPGSTLVGAGGDPKTTGFVPFRVSGRNSANRGEADSLRINVVDPASSGTAGRISKWINSSLLGNSIISESGQSVVVGGTLSATQYNLNGGRILIGGVNGGNTFAGLGAGYFSPVIPANICYSCAGNGNSFFGYAAGVLNQDGAENSFFGKNAGYFNSTGMTNSFFGSDAGYHAETGHNNSFFGAAAGYSNSQGSSNAFYGNRAGFANTLGRDNSFFGVNAGEDSAGSNNVIVGALANFRPSAITLENASAGDQNTFVGSGAAGASARRNATAIGAGAYVACDNCMVLGNNTVRVGIGTNSPVYKLHVNGQVAGVGSYVNLSDARYKTNVQTLTRALDTVRRLRGVSYFWRQGEYPELNFSTGSQIGFIAQEVEMTLPQAVTKDDSGVYSMSYSSVVPLLVEAIKEQQRQIELLEKKIERLSKK